jgi:hypothetical protein
MSEDNKWAGTMGFSSLINGIDLLLDSPNPESPYNTEAANEYEEAQKQFNTLSENVYDLNEIERIREEVFGPLREKYATLYPENEHIISMYNIDYDAEEFNPIKAMCEKNSKKQVTNEKPIDKEALLQKLRQKKKKI